MDLETANKEIQRLQEELKELQSITAYASGRGVTAVNRWITPGGGMDVKGTKVLYKVPVLREYDENGDLVDIGSETDPLAAGHSLKWTIDWGTRAH